MKRKKASAAGPKGPTKVDAAPALSNEHEAEAPSVTPTRPDLVSTLKSQLGDVYGVGNPRGHGGGEGKADKPKDDYDAFVEEMGL